MLTTSVLIPSYKRPERLAVCLRSLEDQVVPPNEVIVVWQSDDRTTLDAAEFFRKTAPFPVHVVYCPVAGIVPAENVALSHASGDVLLLLDDDAAVHPRWLECHLRHYADPNVGAVGAPTRNFDLDGRPFPVREPKHIGRLTWYGRMIGNLFDLPEKWSARLPAEVDHLPANNMSVRRSAFEIFEEALKPYWQTFECDACFQVKSRGYRILLDFSNTVSHYPTNPIFRQTREGDLALMVFHPAYNHALVLAKHCRGMQRGVCLLYLLAIGSVASPGVVGFVAAFLRYGNIRRELRIFRETIRWRLTGWSAGSRLRVSAPARAMFLQHAK